jgi:hypothetical protein
MSEIKSCTYRDRYRAAVFMVHIEIMNPIIATIFDALIW